jgi:Holliday junction resolvase RusA-like endonuclease
VWRDDSQVAELRVRRAFDKQKPRIELVVEAISAAV